METITLSVPTVHCRSCKLTIEEALDELPGIAGSDVDLDSKQMTVTLDPTAVDRTAITTAIEEAGYTVSSRRTARRRRGVSPTIAADRIRR